MEYTKQILLLLICLFVCCFYKQLEAHGPVHESIERLTKSIETFPDSADLYLQRGQFYKIDEDFDKAFADYNKARSLNPDNKHADLQCAKLFLEYDYPISALMYINKVLEETPTHVDGLMTRAAIYTRLNDNELAVSDFEEAIKAVREPRPEYYIAISKAVIAADSTNYKDAIAWLQKGEETLGSNIVLRSYAIDLAILEKDHNQALILIDELIETMKRKEKWLFKKAEILEKAGRIQEAYSYCEQATNAIQKLPRHIQGTRLITELEGNIALKMIELK